MKLSTFNSQLSTSKGFIQAPTFFKNGAGFTLIELLVVIALISILATSLIVLINPLEQISRGNDTANTSDARQLLDAVNRFYANQGYYPWQSSATATMSTGPIAVGTSWDNDAGTDVLTVLSSNTSGGPEINSSFINKVSSSSYNKLYVYNGSDSSNPNKSTYVCFKPNSKAILNKNKIKWGATCGNMSNFSDIGAGAGPVYTWSTTPVFTICDGADLYATCLP